MKTKLRFPPETQRCDVPEHELAAFDAEQAIRGALSQPTIEHSAPASYQFRFAPETKRCDVSEHELAAFDAEQVVRGVLMPSKPAVAPSKEEMPVPRIKVRSTMVRGVQTAEQAVKMAVFDDPK